MTTRRTVLKSMAALGIAGMLPRTVASAETPEETVEEYHVGSLIDMSAGIDLGQGWPVYDVWESSEGITVERATPEGMIIGVGRGPSIRAAIANVTVVSQEITRGPVRVVPREGMPA